MSKSVGKLYSGNDAADELFAPNLDDEQESVGSAQSADESVDDGDLSSVDGAGAIRDELEDIEGLIQAAKGL